MEYEVEGPRPRGRPTRIWREVVKEDCQARKLNKEDRSRWRKMKKYVRWSGWVWVDECFFWYRPTWAVLDKRPLCVCVCMKVNWPEASCSAAAKSHVSASTAEQTTSSRRCCPGKYAHTVPPANHDHNSVKSEPIKFFFTGKFPSKFVVK